MKKLIIIIIIPLLLVSNAKAEESAPTAAHIKDSKIWILDSPSEWPAMIRPGIMGGGGRTIYYSDFLIPAVGTENLLVFINPKLNWDDHDANEQNIGIGLRHMAFEENVILGANLYYDFFKSYYGNRFEQWGFGVEALSRWVDVRANFYFPQSSKIVLDQEITHEFASRSLNKLTTSTYEEPMQGVDYEAGALIPFISDYVETRAFIGGYNYTADLGPDINGIKARLEIMPIPLLTLDVKVSNDNVSSTEAYVGGYVTLPFSIGNMLKSGNPFESMEKFFSFGKGARPLRDRMTDMVMRDMDVLVKEITPAPVETKVIDGLTYVDNSNTTGIEDGSYEHPYRTIQEGVDNAFGDKWVYVRQGNDGYNEVVKLSDDTVLWGSGYDGGFKGILATGYPVIDGTGLPGDSSLVTIRDNNTVMGLHLQNAPSNGIIFTDGITSTGTINNNIIKDSGWDGINLSNNTGTISGFTISDNSITGSYWRGIDLSNNSGTMQNFSILNNIACDSQGGGGDESFDTGGIIAVENTGTMSGFTISGNIANGYLGGGGISFGYNMGTLSDFIISNNECNINSYGLYLHGNGSPHGVAIMKNFTISDNTFNGNGFVGIDLVDNGSRKGDGDMINFIISRNTVNENHLRGIIIGNGSEHYGTMSDFIFSENTISNNGKDGMSLSFNGGNPISLGSRGIMTNFTFTGNTITGNGYKYPSSSGGYGIIIDDNGLNGYGEMSGFVFSRNIISDNRSNGININANGSNGEGVMKNFSFTYNSINNNKINGISITRNGERGGIGTMSDFTISHNTITGSGHYGINLSENSGTMTGFTISNNSIKDSGWDGINLSENTGTISGFTISDNSITGSYWRGIDLSNNSGTMQNFNILNNIACDSQGGGSISDYVGGIIGVSNTGTMSGFTISGNTANGYEGGTGISFYKNKGKIEGFLISDNTCNLNTEGLSLGGNARPGGVAVMKDFTISGNTFNDNGFVGLTFFDNGSEGDGDMSNFTISGNTINGNQMTGINLSTNGSNGYGIMTGFVLSGNTINNNGLIGIDISYNGGNPIYFSNRGIMENFTFTENTITGNGFRSLSPSGGDGILISDNGLRGEGTMSGFVFSGNIISDNRSNGIRIKDNGYQGTGTIENFTFMHNTLSNNHANGITMTGNGDRGGTGTIDNFTFTRNTIIGNYQNGMVFNNEAGGTMSRINLGDGVSGGYNSIYANNIEGGAYYDIDNQTLTNINAQNNWWGTTDSKIIEANINSKDNITYSPYLHSEP
ncbi:MAG TPA: right-handed parallel beta-helix repeat-containing protein [Desulfomonilia bacterium]